MFVSTAGMKIDIKKPTILLMHGSGLSHIVWSLHEQFYASQGFNVLSVDLPGHGDSDGPALKSIQDISDWIKEVMNVTKIEKIIFIGHSQGCLVGIDFGSRYPDLIDKLITEELNKTKKRVGDEIFKKVSFENAAKIFREMITKKDFDGFLTLPLYEKI